MAKSDFNKVKQQRKLEKNEQIVVPEDPYSVTLSQTDEVTHSSSMHSETVAPLDSNLKTHKTSFYLTSSEIKKLKDLEFAYWQRHEQPINRNDLVRYLIDGCTIDSFDDLDPS